jgi:hypothetical protein
MLSRRLIGVLLGGLLAAAALAEDDLPTNVTVSVDGVAVNGVVGYRIEFNRMTIPRTDSRRLDLAYSPDTRRLFLTVNQKALSQFQEWLNSATDGGTPTPRTVTLTAKNPQEQVLAQWEISGVLPTTLSSAASGVFVEVTVTLEFVFDRMRLVQAKGN